MSEPGLRDPGSRRNREQMRESHRQLRRQFKEWERQVRRLLMEWDALGVSGVFNVPDEYDCMISPLLRRLLDGTNTRSLAGWIRHQRSSHFGLGPDDARDMQLAERLTAWWEGQRTAPT